MNYKVLLILSLSISSSIMFAQIPVPIDIIMIEKEQTCTGTQNAGMITAAMPNPSNQGSLVDLSDTIFLCFGDGGQIIHNGDYRLDGDPDPSTPGEIGYAFYSCSPSVFGDELVSIQNDPCVINTPPTPNGVYIARGEPLPNPDLELNNDGSLNQLFSAGAPTLIHFAPITYDAYNTLDQRVIFENNGSYNSL